MHPTSEPLHESSSQTNPGAAKRTYDERAAFEEAKRNLGIVGDKEQQFDRGMAILGKAYSIAMTLILVYFLLDAYQIIVTAGRSVNIGSFLSYALPKVLSDAVLVVPFLWIVLDWVKDGYINPRRLIMLYLLLCSLSGVLAFAGVFGLAQVLFPAFTALDPVSHPAAASSMVSQALVGVITAGSAVLMFLLTRPAVGVVPSPAAIRKQMQIIKDSMADDEEEPTREDVLRQLEEDEGPVKDSTEQLLRELSADYALSKDPAEKNRLLAEIQQVQRAQKTGVKPNFGGASGGSDKPQQEAHEGAEATAASTAPAAPQVVLPPRPKALRIVMRCFVAIMAVEATHKIFLHMIDERSAGGVELWVGFIIPGAVLLLVEHAIPMFVLWRLWRGRFWAYVVIFISFAYIAIRGLIDFVNTFLTTGYLSRLLNGTQTWSSQYYAAAVLSENVADTLITLLSILIVVLLISRSTRLFMATARLARMEAREQVNAGGGHVIGHQSADAETRARLEDEQTRREEKEANRRAEEAVAQQYRRTRRTDARKNSRNEQRGYKDTSVYTEEGYRLN
ncbi:MAG: ABC transporter permease [Rothia sp.]|uniref:ABC transporter permease n=1 Tax=Rothia sp. (in: high G+C Gram-positive bacteria) TaxID=1885016 RepID=UPI001CAC4CBA|nr:ABC transporter permease [Rothia sp. (in: high G+C Gram-positive bacteria)]MBF1680096.1 ABC transporter permease [Rothia sp. (in: high G+C Gram-positive bacteria)]